MSKQIHNSPHGSHQHMHRHHASKSLSPTGKISIKNENIATSTNKNADNNQHYDFIEEIKELEREADKQSAEVELSDCVEFISQLVDLFKHSIIIPELQCEKDSQEHIRRQLKEQKGITGNSHLDDKIEKIAIQKGFTKEQWKSLLYLNFTAGDILEMTTVSRSHLKKVHDMASRLLAGDEQVPVFVLIDAIEKHMPKSHFTER